MNTNLTDITIVLDRSGSMGAVRQDTIGGFNAYIEEQKAVPGDASFTLVQFDDQYEVVYNAVPLVKVKPLTHRTFVPRGSTAMLDAIGRSIIATGERLAAMSDDERPGKVLFVIMTDGEENSSHEFTRKKVFEMISHQRDKYQWQVAFIGANQDAIANGASIGIPVSNSLNYASTGIGTQTAIRTASAATANYRKGAGGQSVGFFNDPDKDANKSA